MFPTTVTRVLQPHLLGAQEGWRLQTGVQFEAPEQVCRQGEVQNEDTTGYNHSIACRGLGSAHRSHRCLLSCSNSSQVQASIEVRPTDGGQSQGVSVPSSAIRPNIGTPGFSQGDIASGKFVHLHGLHLIQYLDDWILKHQGRASLIQENAWLKAVICKVGLVVNEEKSQFVPTQRFVHIGIEYHLDEGLISPPPWT